MPARLEQFEALRHRPGLVCGAGLAAFVDGILFHQILQWHHFVSDVEGNPTDTVAGLERNTLADGLFHAAGWLTLAAAMLAGGALFNLVDATLTHWVLGLHHIHEGSYELLSDVIYFVVSAGLLAVALVLGGRARGDDGSLNRPPAAVGPPAPG